MLNAKTPRAPRKHARRKRTRFPNHSWRLVLAALAPWRSSSRQPDSASLGEARPSFDNLRPSLGERSSSFGGRRPGFGEPPSSLGERRPSLGERRGGRREHRGDRREPVLSLAEPRPSPGEQPERDIAPVAPPKKDLSRYLPFDPPQDTCPGGADIYPPDADECPEGAPPVRAAEHAGDPCAKTPRMKKPTGWMRLGGTSPGENPAAVLLYTLMSPTVNQPNPRKSSFRYRWGTDRHGKGGM